MIVHIVFWRLHERGANGQSKEENALEMRRRFEALRGVIPGLLRCEIGIDVAHTPDSVDVALYSEFESMAALDAYQPHPAHQEIIAFLKDVRFERRVIDYER
jgi:quinol monooxygenase YgiN